MRCSFVAGTEVGFVSFLFLFVPLYTRIKKENALDHFVRGRIFEYIRLKPGQHYNAIRSRLNLTNGTLAYHLKTLEMQNFIKYKRVGLFKCFYPIEYKFGKDETRIKLSNLQQKILNEVETKPGITQKELISKLKGSQQNISYNLKIMERNDILRAEEVGRIVKYYPPKEILHTDT